MGGTNEALVKVYMPPDLAEAVETEAIRQGRSVSSLMRDAAYRATDLDERAQDDPPADDADLVERAVAGLAGAGAALFDRAASADEAGKASLLHALIGYVVYLSGRSPDPADIRQVAELAGRQIGYRAKRCSGTGSSD